MKELKWMGDSLWQELPDYRMPSFGGKPAMRRQCVGQVRPHERGTYWQAYLYMGNIRASFPTKQEAMDFLVLMARSTT